MLGFTPTGCHETCFLSRKGVILAGLRSTFVLRFLKFLTLMDKKCVMFSSYSCTTIRYLTLINIASLKDLYIFCINFMTTKKLIMLNSAKVPKYGEKNTKEEKELKKSCLCNSCLKVLLRYVSLLYNSK